MGRPLRNGDIPLKLESRSILILGGSPLQREMLRAAKELGFETHIVDSNSQCALRDDADRFHNVDFSNIIELSKIVKEFRPRIVTASASEVGNISATEVSNLFELPSNTIESVHASTNKILMKRELEKAGVPTSNMIDSGRLSDFDREQFLARELESPFVVKPSQSSAGRGVSVVRSTRDLINAVEMACAASRDGCFLIEEFVHGPQFSVEAISIAGDHRIICVTEERFLAGAETVECGQILPASLSEEIEIRIRSVVSAALSALGVNVGASHTEVRVEAGGSPIVIEVASRTGGWRAEMIRSALGLDICKLHLGALGGALELDFNPSSSAVTMVRMIFSESDVKLYKGLTDDDSVKVFGLQMLRSNLPSRALSLIDSAGYFFVTAKDRNLLDGALRRAELAVALKGDN